MAITVIVAPEDTWLTTLARVKSILGITDTSSDSLLEQQIQEISDFISTFTGRIFARQTIAESIRGDGLPDMLLSLTPILTITSIELNGNAVTDYEILDADIGIIQRETGWTSTNLPFNTIDFAPSSYFTKDWVVTYEGGYRLPNWNDSDERSLPYDLERAAIEMVKSSYINRGVDSSWKSYKIGETAVSWNKAPGTEAISSIIPDAAMGVLNYYRRPY